MNETDRQLAIGQSLRATLIVKLEVDGTEWLASGSGCLIPSEGNPVPDGYTTGRTSDLVYVEDNRTRMPRSCSPWPCYIND
jgi:hypothetical protein